jgi:hypothetical protein
MRVSPPPPGLRPRVAPRDPGGPGYRKVFRCIVFSALLMTGWMLAPSTARGESAYDCAAEQSRSEPTRLEITLSKKWKKQSNEIKAAFNQDLPDLKVRIEFIPFLDPPMNIGIGRCVPAEKARWAMHQAIRYNGGINWVILQGVLPHHFMGVGTTKLAELSWMPISPEELDRLMDPALTTEAFHTLYRELAKMTERKRPFGFDPVPYEPPQNGQTTPLPESPR